ncbi:DUF4167 domain-containing protein [Phenylobacterium montanum]
MKRQRSRNRSGGGGGKPQHNANRAFESNGPDGVKIRGAAQHVYEKYQQLARDALTSGDRILAESYQQHAEHYFRVLRAMQPQRPASDIIGRDAFAGGFDIDFEDEGQQEAETAEAAEGEGEQRQEGRSDWRGERQDRQRDDRGRDDRQRDDRPRDENRRDRDRGFNRDDRNREDRYRDDRPRDDRPREDRSRDDRQRDDRPRDDRPRDENRRDRFRDRDRDRDRGERDRDDRPPREERSSERRFERVDPMAVVEPQALPLTAPAEPAPSSPMLRSEDGGVSHAPAFLQARSEPKAAADAKAPDAEETAETKPARAPRRRRAPRNLETAEGAGPTAGETEDA